MRHALCAGLAAAALASQAAAGVQLVTNGGFEDNPMVGVTPVGWTTSGNPYYTGISIGAAHSGQAAYDFGGSQALGLGFLSQSLSTVPGAAYNLEFYLLIPGGSPTEFVANVGGDASSGALVGGSTLIDLVDPPTTETDPQDFTSEYHLFTKAFTATSTATELNIGAYNNPSFFLLDDVSVTPVPEPAAWGLASLGLGLLGARLRRRRSLTAAF